MLSTPLVMTNLYAKSQANYVAKSASEPSSRLSVLSISLKFVEHRSALSATRRVVSVKGFHSRALQVEKSLKNTSHPTDKA